MPDRPQDRDSAATPLRRFLSSVLFCAWGAIAVLSGVEMIASADAGNAWWALGHAAMTVGFVGLAVLSARDALRREVSA